MARKTLDDSYGDEETVERREAALRRGRSRLFGYVCAVSLPYKPKISRELTPKLLKSLARPRGIEPRFPP